MTRPARKRSPSPKPPTPWLTVTAAPGLAASDARRWELAAWIGTTTGRQTLAIALSEMVRNSEVKRGRAEEMATMVMRTNSAKLYKLPMK